MKKIIVFGASGGTGAAIVRLALADGHVVTAVLRNPDAFALRDPDGFMLREPRLSIIKGDVLDASSFVDAMKGNDIVISAIGNQSTKPTTVYSAGVDNILHAMRVQGITRFIGITAGALDTNPAMGFFIRLLTRLVLQKILKEPYADMRRMESALLHSGADYMILRPARLTDKPLTGKYRVAINGHIRVPFSIARADLAHYITTHLEDPQTFRSIVEIAY